MKIGVCTDRNESSRTCGIRGEIIFSPLFEMMASMHVICDPEHHTGRKNWWKNLSETVDPVLVIKIKELENLTDEWMIPMDFGLEEPIMEMDIPETLRTLNDYPLSKWKKIFAHYEKKVTIPDKNQMLAVLSQYYEKVFREELNFLEPLLVRELRKMYNIWKEEGFASSLGEFHNRISLQEKELVLYKDHEYHFLYQDIETIQVTGSTFLSPHLVMGNIGNTVTLTRHYYTEKVEQVPPEDLTKLYNGLADGTRLRILKYLKRRQDSTQSLAKKLQISEAAVSKQLKVLSDGGLVEKKRDGNYVFYSICPEALDWLTYRIYEYLN